MTTSEQPNEGGEDAEWVLDPDPQYVPESFFKWLSEQREAPNQADLSGWYDPLLDPSPAASGPKEDA